MSAARDGILSALRAARGARSAAPGVAAHLLPARAAGEAAALRARFVTEAEYAGAVVSLVSGLSDVPAAVADAVAALSAASDAATVAVAPGGALDGLAWADSERARYRVGPPVPTDRVSITGAVAGIAETGTVLVAAGQAVANAAHFLAEAHVVVLPASLIVGGYEDAWRLLRESMPSGAPPRAATFITGPSRTADIEKTPQIGVHGPRRLHILLVGE